MPLGQLDGALEQRPRIARRAGHRRAPQQPPEDGEGLLVLDGGLEIELDVLPRVRPRAVDDAEAGSREAEAPARALTDAEPHGVAPGRRWVLSPRRDEQSCPWNSGHLQHGAEPLRRRVGRHDVIAEPRQKRFPEPIEDGAERQRRAKLSAQRHVPGAETSARRLTPLVVEQLTELVGKDPREDLVRQQGAGKAGNHRRSGTRSAAMSLGAALDW